MSDKEIYYGSKLKQPKNTRRPTKKEALEAHQVRYWGLKTENIDKMIKDRQEEIKKLRSDRLNLNES